MEKLSTFDDNTVVLYRGTSQNEFERIKRNSIGNRLSWWSTDPSIVGHYYDGCAIKLELKLNPSVEMEYEREEYYVHGYTYGSAVMACPEVHVWYSISGDYLKDNMVSLEEIFEWPCEDEEEEIML